MAKTEIKVGEADFQKANVHWDYHFKVLMLRYLLLKEHDPSDPFIDRYFLRTREKQKGPLTAAEIAEMVEVQLAESSTVEIRTKEMDVTVDIDEARASTLTSRYRFAYILQDFLKANPQIRSVANIGARVDFYSAYLARQFPDRTFYSIDFQPTLAEHNSLLPQQGNWHFRPGYPLHVIRSGQVNADMYFCVSTSVLMNNGELNSYLDAMATHAKAIAFCEGWWAELERRKPGITPPEDVPKEEPFCGGAYASYHHNYIAKLEERGYEIRLSQMVPENDAFHYLQIIAVKP
jgi:hypothetical protein